MVRPVIFAHLPTRASWLIGKKIARRGESSECLKASLTSGSKNTAHALLPDVLIDSSGRRLLFFLREWWCGQRGEQPVKNEHFDFGLRLFLFSPPFAPGDKLAQRIQQPLARCFTRSRSDPPSLW